MTDEPEEVDGEEEEIGLDQEEVEEIVEWAIHTAATITLMHHAPNHDNDKEGIERLEGYIQALEMMYEDMPASIVDVSHNLATAIIEDAEKTENIVDEFKQELDKL